MELVAVFFTISIILFFGLTAEFVFKRFNIPDVLFLLILGIIIGPFALNYVQPSQVAPFAPFFTTFALLFLLYEGAFNIDLKSFAKGITKSMSLTMFNLLISAVGIFIIMLLFGFDILPSLATGFMLGGVSSAFVIPVIKQLKISKRVYSLLTLESALTDVFAIVFTLAIFEIIQLGIFNIRDILIQIASLFAVAGLFGIVFAIIWIVIATKIFKQYKSYMATIAAVLLVYSITEFLNGNGAIATLAFGLVLRNSKQLTSILVGITSTKKSDKKQAIDGKLGVRVIGEEEEFFYNQISFFLKTFFFVYIGTLLDLSDWKALLIGILITIAIMGMRLGSTAITKESTKFEKGIITATFARGLAAAALAQIAITQNIVGADLIAKIIYVVVIGTILGSSIRIYILQTQYRAKSSKTDVKLGKSQNKRLKFLKRFINK